MIPRRDYIERFISDNKINIDEPFLIVDAKTGNIDSYDLYKLDVCYYEQTYTLTNTTNNNKDFKTLVDLLSNNKVVVHQDRKWKLIPDRGDIYYYVDNIDKFDNPTIKKKVWVNNLHDYMYWFSRNIFKTKKEITPDVISRLSMFYKERRG